ncbi:hypothetical protein STEG23_016142 [Scotinomys teguina]
MARKVEQGEEKEESRARQQGGETRACHEEEKMYEIRSEDTRGGKMYELPGKHWVGTLVLGVTALIAIAAIAAIAASFVSSAAALDKQVHNKSFEDLSTTRVSVQEEIVNKHNQLRRMVSPPGSDLLKMYGAISIIMTELKSNLLTLVSSDKQQWNKDAPVNAQRWAAQCIDEHSSREARTTNVKCNENIFTASYLASWTCVIQSWYDEAKDFRAMMLSFASIFMVPFGPRVTAVDVHSHLYLNGPFCITAFDKTRMYICSSLK